MQTKHYLNVITGVKTVDGRLNRGKFANMKKGQTIIINGTYKTKIAKVVKYKTFKEMLEKETLGSVLPGMYDIDEGVKVYRQFYSETNEWEFGVIAIHLTRGVIIALVVNNEEILKNRPRSSSGAFSMKPAKKSTKPKKSKKKSKAHG